jgi:argininosuccinate lyase
VFFDQRMWRQDIRGSLAHARMLARQGIISGADLAAIESGMATISSEIEAGTFNWNLDDEDVHLNIEKRLTALVGDSGKRLHTGRSRNDQVATDIRLWLRDTIDGIDRCCCKNFRRRCWMSRKRMQKRQCRALPICRSRNRSRSATTCWRMSKCWGATAAALRIAVGAPIGFPWERQHSPVPRSRSTANLSPGNLALTASAKTRWTPSPTEISPSSSVPPRHLVMTHVSRFSEELILWMSPRVGFIDLADRFCTGSSIMPQKKNPDVPELARGKTGRVYGHLMGLLTLMKGQPLAYNKDNQEDKEPLFDTADTLVDTLRIFADLVPGIRVKADAMAAALRQGYATATDLADYLVKKGLPFRDAHEAVARAVRSCEAKGCDLPDLALPELQQFSPLIGDDVFSVLTVAGSLGARNHVGGTAPAQVRAAIARARNRL